MEILKLFTILEAPEGSGSCEPQASKAQKMDIATSGSATQKQSEGSEPVFDFPDANM